MSIKKVLLVKLAVSFIAIGLISCAGKKTQEAPTARGGFTNHQPETLCAVSDDDNFFRAKGIANGPHPRRDFVKTTAIANAQREIVVRTSNSILGVIDQHATSLGSAAGTDVSDALRVDLQSIVAKTLNDAAVICGPLYSDIDDKGHLEVIVAIQISKKVVSEKLRNHVESVVPENERARLQNELNNIGRRIDEALQRVRQ